MSKPKPETPNTPPAPAGNNSIEAFRPFGLTLADWAADADRREKLRLALLNPTLREAFETLRSVYAPAAPAQVSIPGPVLGDIPPELGELLSLRFCFSSGFTSFLTALHNLAIERVKSQDTPTPFGTLKPETE